MKNLLRYSFALFAAAMIFSGCSEGDERRHPLYRKALQDQQSGKGADAAEKLCELLKRRPRSIYAHKLLATVYDEMLNDPASAVYHYQKYLESLPDAVDSEEVQAWRMQAEKRHYQLLHERFSKETVSPMPGTSEKAPEEPVKNADHTVQPETPASSTEEITAAAEHSSSAPAAGTAGENINEEIAVRDKQIAELQLKLARYQARHKAMRQEVEKMRKERQNQKRSATQINQSAAAEPSPAAAAVQSQYKVVNGDTPGSIARKVYGKSSLYYVIMQANPQVNARKLRPGTILNIPHRIENQDQRSAR